MLKHLGILLLLITCFVSNAFAQENKVANIVFTCKKDSDVRTITQVFGEPDVHGGQSCQVVYRKQGKSKITGRSWNPKFCDTQANKIKSNLEKSGYTCS